MIKDLWTTEVGSMMWGMFKPGISDHDFITVRQHSTKNILEGKYLPNTWPQTKRLDPTNTEIDQSYIEIGHLVHMLLKGNINYLWAVMSPIVVNDHSLLQDLRGIVASNPSKLPYQSIRGMATSQKLDETKRPRLSGGKGYRTAARTALFGSKLLKDWTFDFTVPKSIVNLEITLPEVEVCLDELTFSYETSGLPEFPDPEPFEKFLLDLRLQDINEVILCKDHR